MRSLHAILSTGISATALCAIAYTTGILLWVLITALLIAQIAAMLWCAR